MKIACMTTMNQEYYDHIGDIMLDSWFKHWPSEISLHVFQEGFDLPENNRLIKHDWDENCLEAWTRFSEKGYGTASKFAKKGFAFLAGMKQIDCDLLIWVDADTLTYQHFPFDKIQNILPNDKLIAVFDTLYQIKPDYTLAEYLDPNRILTACESGFVILNKRHKNFNEMVERYEHFYTLDVKPDYLGDWYDTNVLMASVKDLRTEVYDLSQLRTTNKTQTPINRCWIGEYVHHAKGKVKRHKDKNVYRSQIGI